jgi:GNAT superfamily N-acetyltransferase
VALTARDAPAGLLIRPATAADLPRILEIFVGGVPPGGVPSKEDPCDLGPYRDALTEIERGDGAVLVAELDGTVVGACQLIVFRHLQARGGRCAEIESVHVHDDYRGTGIGGALVGDAVERARALGCYRVQLTSNVVRQDAHRFYERLGFVPSHVGFKLVFH